MNALTWLFRSNFSEIIERCKVALCNFQVKDFIEIIVLTAMLFLGVQLLRGRKAGALAMGILVITIFWIVSEYFELKVLPEFFGSIVANGILVVIIIFQPEIRDALEKIGKGSIKGLMNLSERNKRKEQYINAIDNICSAVTELSNDSTGALIVIERTVKLADIIQMGAVIDANVNDLLLRNLFFNRSPLHDGAVVISGDKIVAAGCFLPLTEREDIDTTLGTRHRAAIGIAEKSDSVVIVVSEETGAISVAYDFSLLRNITPIMLKSFLHEQVLRICDESEE
jgi:diadenylate cyclase